MGSGELALLPLAALAGVVTLFSLYSVALRQMAALPSAAVVCVASIGGALAVSPARCSPRSIRGDAVSQAHARARSPRCSSRGQRAARLGSLAWAAVLSRVRAAVAALGLYLIPIGGALASHFFLDEPLYARDAVGALIVIAAVVLARSGGRARRPS